jgi:hypothetical protein
VTQSRPSEGIADSGGDLPVFDTTVANPARMWNYWVGGKDHFGVDRTAAQNVLQALPTLPLLARFTRRFLVDAVDELAADRGIRQFLDIGTGLPTADNTHEVAQRTAPESRIVYVDHDPIVLSHARALLTSRPEGRTDYLQADLRDTGTVMTGAARTLDLSQPVAVMLIAILHFIPDADDPYLIVSRLMDAVPSGSYLVIAHWTEDIQHDEAAEATRRYNERSAVPITPRRQDQVARFFDGLELTAPGVVPIGQWFGPDEAESAASALAGYVGIARKP